MGEGWPVMGTTIVVGITFGVVARQAGLEPIEITAMSLLVFAGASEFAMVRLFSEGAATPLVIATVLFINLRHLLMAASLRPYFMRLELTRRLAAAFFNAEAMAASLSRLARSAPDIPGVVCAMASSALSLSAIGLPAACVSRIERRPFISGKGT